ncbi:hypothetical protein [Brevibacillus choshinensis]|uniref:hypothetical protein n=1 Tax=Brevibacillus choshinensis TaxID=54911 RepID=UPI002E1A263F|nr:hypothetical protein [Brevibacillus choshinensis]
MERKVVGQTATADFQIGVRRTLQIRFLSGAPGKNDDQLSSREFERSAHERRDEAALGKGSRKNKRKACVIRACPFLSRMVRYISQ